SIPRLRRTRAGPETRTWRGSGRGAVRVRARADGRSRGGVPQPATSRGRWIGRNNGLVRGHRLHAVAATPRRVEHGGPIIHGAPPGDEPAFVRVCAFGATDAKALRVGPALPSDVASASGARSESHAVSFERSRCVR